MNKNDKPALVPKLRFPEFLSTGEWKISMLSNLACKITVRNQDNLTNRVLTNSAVDGVVDQSDYFDREVANQNNLENYFVIDKGDYVYNPRISATAPVGPISKNKVGKGVMSPLYTVFRFKSHNNDFYEQYFKTNLWHAYLKNVSNTGARHDRMSISNDNFMKMPLPYHSNEEQQKIADCLTSLDDLIIAEEKKLEALKRHKKGLMQKLFPAEGETVPEWRFSEFRDSGEWETKTLGQLVNVLMCKRIFAHETNENNGVPFYKIGTLGGKPDAFINQDLFYEYKSRYNYPRKGEILITCSGTVGKCLQYDGAEAYYQDSNIVWLDNPSLKVSNELLLNLLLNVNWAKLNSTTITRIYGSDLRNLSMVFPKDVEEQQKISDFVSGLEILITAQSKKIESLKLHKKGLMQGLFPSAREVVE